MGAVALAACTPTPDGSEDVSRYILPPGNYGGLPTTDNSRDQLPLYDALTPLRGNVTDDDIQRFFLPQDFEPIGETREEETGRPGLRLVYDEYGVPHIYGETRADVGFGVGWVTARDRGLLIQFGRNAARVAAADVPGVDAFELVTSAQPFVPSAAAEDLLTRQQDLLVETYGDKGRQIVADAQASADGVNAYWAANGIDQPPVSANDVLAITAFIGSIFGAGGGAEATNADLLSKLQAQLGPEEGRAAWDDAMLSDDPEAPTTTDRRFDYGPLTGGEVRGSVVIDADSLVPLDARQGPEPPASGAGAGDAGSVDATAAPPRREASNFLMTDPARSATGNSLAVMGPQLGYYYPEIVQQVHLSGPGYEAQGIAVPGVPYVLIGRTEDYAWSLTSAGHDVRDVFAEQLCEPDGSEPTRESRHYVFDGECRPMETFDAGVLNGQSLVYPVTVHGPVIGTATVGGEPYALSRQRSTFGRDALNLAALMDMTNGEATTPRRFRRVANQFEFTFNWAYASRDRTAFFSSGRLPRRAEGLDRRLPTLGTGEYEWQGFLRRREHPRDVGGPDGLLLNWNNQSAPGFMHGDDAGFGSVQRVELFDRFPEEVRLKDVVGIMNRAATEDVRSPVWPVVSEVLRTGDAPTPLAASVVDVLDDWVRRDAPRLDADLDGSYDDAGPTIMDAVWDPLAETVMRPVYGELLLEDLDDVRNLGGAAGHSYVDKDLRTLLGEPVEGPFNLSYCGNGSLEACRASLWA
ncbi:MAG: penicillin acylase family protein, partial [Acidimicrobiia bacterium]|nr:penicillin acylase family protein [Acidimicrobiia bacterium]